VLRDAYHGFVWKFQNDREAAAQLLSVGEYPRDRRLAVEPLAAMTMVASTILNLDEVIMK